MAWSYNTPDGTPDNGPHIAAVILSLTILALIAVCLRLYVRMMIIKAMGPDDWIITFTGISCWVLTSLIVLETKWGLGLLDVKDLPEQNLIQFGIVQYFGAFFYVVGVWGFKTSLLISYMRFLLGWYRIACIVIAIAVTLSHIAIACVFLFSCTPVEKFWKPYLPGHCIDGHPFYLASAIITIVFDIAVILLPFPTLLTLQMKLRKKLVLLGLFALGVFLTIVQLIRIQLINNIQNYLNAAAAIQWSVIETAIGIIIACIPTLTPLVKYFSDRTRIGSGSHQPSAGGQGTASARKGDDAQYTLQGSHSGPLTDKDSDGDLKPADESTW